MKRSFLNVIALKSTFNSGNMHVIARFRASPMRSVGSRFSGSRSQAWSSVQWRGFSFAAEIRRTLLLGKWSSLLSAFESRRFAEFPPRFRDIVDNLRCHWPNLFSRLSFFVSSSAERRSLGISPLAVLRRGNLVGFAK